MTRQSKSLTRSFAGGEMSPEMFGRLDDVQFQSGAETLLNMVPRPTGSAARRSGTKLVRQTKSTGTPHLFPFVFSQTESLVVEAGRATIGGLDSGYFRFHNQGNTLLYNTKDSFHTSKIVVARDWVEVTVNTGSNSFTLSNHGLQVGDQIQMFATGVPTTSPQIDQGDQVKVASVTTNSFTIQTTAGSSISISERGFEVGFRGARLRSSATYGTGDHGYFTTQYLSGDRAHNLRAGDEVYLTAEPFSTSNVSFDGSYFRFEAQAGTSANPPTSNFGLGRDDPDELGQQVVFFGSDLPQNIVEGRPYYIIKNDSTSGGRKVWRISDTRGGAPFGSGGTDYAVSTTQNESSMAAMPHGFDMLKSYWVTAITGSTGPVSFPVARFKLSESLGEALSGSGKGIENQLLGTGERRVHKVTTPGQIVWHQGKSYYRRKELIDRSANLTRLAHNQSNTRVPGVRTAADSAEYWREQPGKSTGGAFPATITRVGGKVQVNATAHGLQNNQTVVKVQGFVGVNHSPTLGAGSSTYYVVNRTADSFELAIEFGGTAIDLGAEFSFGGVEMRAFPAFNISTDRVTWIAHGLSEADPVVFNVAADTGGVTASIGNLSVDTTYYVKNKTTDDFQLSTTPYGDAIDLTGTFTSALTANGAAYLEVPHDYTEDELSEISTTQSNDVMTLCSQLQPASELRRLGSQTWETKQINFKASSLPPESLQEIEVDQGEHHEVFGMRIVKQVSQGNGDPDPTASSSDGALVSQPKTEDEMVSVSLHFTVNGENPNSIPPLESHAPPSNSPPYGEGDLLYLTGCTPSTVRMTQGVSVGGDPERATTTFPTFSMQEGYYRVSEALESNNFVTAVLICNPDGTGIRRDQVTVDEGTMCADIRRHCMDTETVLQERAKYYHSEAAGTWAGSSIWRPGTNNLQSAVGSTGWFVNPETKVRLAALNEDTEQTYVVTSIDSNNEESEASESVTVDNNLYVAGAFNRLSWQPSLGATRYRVYKKLSGLYGFIGETDETTFKDDNIGPDLGVAPPIADDSMRKVATVTFNADGDFVSWAGHGLQNGMPVVFQATDYLPNVNDSQTYYVINKTDDTFQIASTDTSETAVTITGSDTGVHTAIAGLFPGATSYYEGRRVFAGSKAQPQDVFMSASGTEADMSFSIPTIDSDRVYFRIAAREQSRVRHVVPIAQMMLLSDSTEYQVTPANDDILTPTSVSVRPQSFVGANKAQPALVNNTVVFGAARGGHIRELGYNAQMLGYLTGDLSIRASHLFDSYTIKDIAYQKAPLPIVWCVSSSGKLLGLTYVPEEKVGAWHQHTTTNGTFESVVSVPEGDEDAVYVLVKRGSDHFIERLGDTYRGGTENINEAFFVDSGVTYSGAATTTINGLSHLNGQSVAYLADGLPGTGTVSGGALTLSKAAAKVHVGYPMTSQVKTLPMTMLNVDAFGSGKTKNITRAWVRIFESAAFEAGPTASSLRSSLTPAAGSLASDFVEVTLPSSWNDDGQIVVQQSNPLPLTIAGMTLEVASGG